VVAAEVRKLSQKAAEAARSTSQLITTNLRMIRESVELVQKTDRNFDDVAQATSKVREFLKQVSSATSEQVEGIIQVNSAVAEINRIAQTSAEMSQDMATLVSRFTLEKTDEGLMEEFGLS
jgi:methyl-accepting chemotaxis protein